MTPEDAMNPADDLPDGTPGSAEPDATGEPVGRARPDEDLSAQIVAAIPKQPEDRVTCRRIHGDNYRCNWWSPADRTAYDNPSMDGLLVTTHTVRKSRFLSVTRTAAGLVIRNAPVAPPAPVH